MYTPQAKTVFEVLVDELDRSWPCGYVGADRIADTISMQSNLPVQEIHGILAGFLESDLIGVETGRNSSVWLTPKGQAWAKSRSSTESLAG